MSYELIPETADIAAVAAVMDRWSAVVSREGADSWMYPNDSTGTYFTVNVDRVVGD